ncbi:MAG: hypothetical protein DRQ59_00715 [Gammaproteobacteria bacterium]|nr:MAG: hypothetical protein DRQ59_00715 [Gammaproteobacteria bacterium]
MASIDRKLLSGGFNHSLNQAVMTPTDLNYGLLSVNNEILSPATSPGPEQLLNQSTEQAAIVSLLLS